MIALSNYSTVNENANRYRKNTQEKRGIQHGFNCAREHHVTWKLNLGTLLSPKVKLLRSMVLL